MIRTLQSNQPIQFIIINGGTHKYNLNLSNFDLDYIFRAISMILSIFIFIGKIIEAHQVTMQKPIITEYVILIKIVWWIIRL